MRANEGSTDSAGQRVRRTRCPPGADEHSAPARHRPPASIATAARRMHVATVPNTFNFADYSAAEMALILARLVVERGFELDEALTPPKLVEVVAQSVRAGSREQRATADYTHARRWRAILRQVAVVFGFTVTRGTLTTLLEADFLDRWTRRARSPRTRWRLVRSMVERRAIARRPTARADGHVSRAHAAARRQEADEAASAGIESVPEVLAKLEAADGAVKQLMAQRCAPSASRPGCPSRRLVAAHDLLSATRAPARRRSRASSRRAFKSLGIPRLGHLVRLGDLVAPRSSRATRARRPSRRSSSSRRRSAASYSSTRPTRSSPTTATPSARRRSTR